MRKKEDDNLIEKYRKHEELESDSEEEDEDERDWKEKFHQLWKDQGSLEDHSIEMDVNLSENEKHMKEKEKEEEEELLIDEFLCGNAWKVCSCNIIQEEGKTTRKETREIEEKNERLIFLRVSWPQWSNF